MSTGGQLSPRDATAGAPDPAGGDRRPRRARRPRSARVREDRRTGYLLISPTAIIVFVMVVLPILKKSLFGSWILIFIIGTRELSTAMFLSGPQTRVVSVLTLELSEPGSYEMLSAISVLLLVVTSVVTLIGAAVLGRDFMLRRN